MADQDVSSGPLGGFEFSHYRIIEQIGSGRTCVGSAVCGQPFEYKSAIRQLLCWVTTEGSDSKIPNKEARPQSCLTHFNIPIIHGFNDHLVVRSSDPFTPSLLKPRETDSQVPRCRLFERSVAA